MYREMFHLSWNSLEQRKLSSYDVLIANENIQNVIKKQIENLFIMANQDLSSIDMNLAEIKKGINIKE